MVGVDNSIPIAGARVAGTRAIGIDYTRKGVCMKRTEMHVSQVVALKGDTLPSQIYCKFGRAQVYFDWLDTDPRMIISGDMYFDEMDHYSVSHVSLWPHVGVYGCGVPWMSMLDRGCQLSVYPDQYRGVIWYELGLPRGMMIKSDDTTRYKLVGSVSLPHDWRSWHYNHFFGVSSLKMGQS